MKLFLFCSTGIFLAVVLYYAVPFLRSVWLGIHLTAQSVPYEKISSDTSLSLLVLGDSTGVGVGASTPNDSVAGRFAAVLGATYVENNAVSGAVVSDLSSQITQAKLSRYSDILIQIGANDIIRFHSVSSVSSELSTILDTLPLHDRAFLMIAGDIGSATIFPAPLRPWYTHATLVYHAAFAAVAKAHAVVYVNLYQPAEQDPFREFPQRYFALDSFHPSSDGYALWAEKLFAAAKNP